MQGFFLSEAEPHHYFSQGKVEQLSASLRNILRLQVHC